MREKHPRPVRWTHWLNVPLFALMAWSGLRIYWANDVYLRLPDAFYARLGLDFRLADGMAVHFFAGWLFALNGLVYVLYNAASGQWRESLSPRGPYNLGQRVLYPLAVAAGAGLVVTGLAIYKPVQLAPLTRLLGGYRLARREHFWLMMGLLGFTGVHVFKVAQAGWLNFRSMADGQPETSHDARLTRRALLSGGAAAALGAGSWAWLLTRPLEDGAPWPLRKVLNADGRLWRALFRPACRAPRSAGVVAGKEARQNGDIGLDQELDLSAWRLRVEGADGAARTMTLAQVQALPRVTLTTDLNCIEGWSDANTFTGARFCEFMDALGLPGARYVGLETPDRGYYVSLDLETMRHPQTLLVYEMNGQALSDDHGAPLRLFTPLKYGIKSLKRVGRIFFSDRRPPDYWEERGYDWYAGL